MCILEEQNDSSVREKLVSQKLERQAGTRLYRASHAPVYSI